MNGEAHNVAFIERKENKGERCQVIFGRNRKLSDIMGSLKNQERA